jgi:CRP/FNR family transcriptional regulator, cyclic AMP receptor protein
MELSKRLLALESVSILADLPRHQLQQIASICKWREYDAGEQILSYHDPSTEVFFLAAGKVRVIIYSAEGKAVVFTDLKPGAMFGEIAAIDRGPRSAGAEASGPCTVASLTAAQFESLLSSHPTVALATLRHVTHEVRRLSERVLEFSRIGSTPNCCGWPPTLGTPLAKRCCPRRRRCRTSPTASAPIARPSRVS